MSVAEVFLGLVDVLNADLAVAEYDPLLRRQAFKADWATGVDLVGRDADFGAEAIFKTIGKTGRCIDHHRAGVDFIQEATRFGVILGQDRVGMV